MKIIIWSFYETFLVQSMIAWAKYIGGKEKNSSLVGFINHSNDTVHKLDKLLEFDSIENSKIFGSVYMIIYNNNSMKSSTQNISHLK